MAKALNKFIISESQPKLTNVGWIKPIEGTNRCDLLFYNNGEWISEGGTSLEVEDLESKMSELEQKTDTLIPQVDENTQAIKAIAVNGGASVASAVIFDNGENAQSRLGDRAADETQMGYVILRKDKTFA